MYFLFKYFSKDIGAVFFYLHVGSISKSMYVFVSSAVCVNTCYMCLLCEFGHWMCGESWHAAKDL